MTTTGPTLLSPWYVVQRNKTYKYNGPEPHENTVQEYWSVAEDEKGAWTVDPHQAMIFMALISAKRIADAEVAEVRVLYDNTGYREFRPKEFVV